MWRWKSSRPWWMLIHLPIRTLQCQLPMRWMGFAVGQWLLLDCLWRWLHKRNRTMWRLQPPWRRPMHCQLHFAFYSFGWRPCASDFWDVDLPSFASFHHGFQNRGFGGFERDPEFPAFAPFLQRGIIRLVIQCTWIHRFRAFSNINPSLKPHI